MELSGKSAYVPVLKTTQLSAHAQNHATPERCRKSFTIIFLGDHDIPLTGSNFGNLTAFRAIFSHIFTAHAQTAALSLAQGHTLFCQITPFLQRAQCSHCKRCISHGNSVRPSVRPSVCPSVCHTPVLCQNDGTYSTMQFSPLDSKMCLVFYKPKNIPEGRPEILAQTDQPLQKVVSFDVLNKF